MTPDLEPISRELGLVHEVADLTGGTAAVFSPDRVYRYALTRTWSDGPAAAWVMLNPSTADAFADDPTIRRCIGFSRAGDFGGLIVLNLFALRATDPAVMRAHDEPIGPCNKAVLSLLAGALGDQIGVWVAAWGVHGSHLGRGQRVRDLLAAAGGVRLRCLGTTKDGHPRHPLYVPASTELALYPGERVA